MAFFRIKVSNKIIVLLTIFTNNIANEAFFFLHGLSSIMISIIIIISSVTLLITFATLWSSSGILVVMIQSSIIIEPTL